jgi:flagellar motor switch protein FliG
MEPLPILHDAPPKLGNRGRPTVLRAPEKAAVILALLGPENASPVVEKIKDEHLRAFIHTLENLKLIPRESLLSAVADFITELAGGFAAARPPQENLLRAYLRRTVPLGCSERSPMQSHNTRHQKRYGPS